MEEEQIGLTLGVHAAAAGSLEGEDKIIEGPSSKIDDFCLWPKGDFVAIRQIVCHVWR